MKIAWQAAAGGGLAVAVGAAGLIRSAVPQAAAEHPSTPGQLTVTGAYVRASVPPTQTAAAYFTVRNGTDSADRLIDVSTGAGAVAKLHTVAADGSMSVMANSVVIPAHGSLVLSTGKGHVMIEQLFGRLRAGENVNIEVDFQEAGSIDVVAPVVAVGAPAPTGSSAPSGAHS